MTIQLDYEKADQSDTKFLHQNSLLISVTILGDSLDFGQFFKAFGKN